MLSEDIVYKSIVDTLETLGLERVSSRDSNIKIYKYRNVLVKVERK